MAVEFKDWTRNAPADRVKQCRRMAEELRGLSKETSDEQAHAYIGLARNWDDLARKIEWATYAELR